MRPLLLALAAGLLLSAPGVRADEPVTVIAQAPDKGSVAGEPQGPVSLGALLERARAALARGEASLAYRTLEPQTRWYAGSPSFDYLLGLSALDAGLPGAAILALERVLAAQPDHLQARAEIARAYLAAREPQAARRELETVAAQPIPAQVRRVIDAYLAGISRSESAVSPQTSAFLEIAGGWDSNVNLGSLSSQWLLAGGLSVIPEKPSQPQSSVQSTVNGGFSWLVPIDGGFQWIGGAQVSHRVNPAAHTLDASTLDLNTGLGWRSNCHTTAMLAQYQHLRLAQERFRDAAGLMAQWRCDLSERLQWGLYAQAADFRFAGQAVRDARRHSVGTTLAYVLALPAAPVLIGNLYLGRETPRQDIDQLRYRFHGARGAVNFQAGGWRWSASLAWEARDYAGAEPLFDQVRSDRQSEMALSAERPLSPKWSLLPQLSALRNRSNLAPNDFKRTQAQLALRYRF